MSYLKVLNPLFNKCIAIFPYQDLTFPKDAQGAPNQEIIRKISITVNILKDLFKGKGKLSKDERFRNKIRDVPFIPMIDIIKTLSQQLKSELDKDLDHLEAIFNHIAAKTNSITVALINNKETSTEVEEKTFLV